MKLQFGIRASRLGSPLLVWGGGILIATGVMCVMQARAGATTPTVTLTPEASGPGSSFDNGEVVEVGVGPNSLFKPGVRVNILECSDPGGTVADLPKSISNCDGNTIQGNTVLVRTDGSIDEAQYTIYQLPSATLGEQSNWQPVCDASNECVLYVGENQEDFTQPKVFSSPFTVSASSASSGSSGASVSSASGPSASGPSGSSGSSMSSGGPSSLVSSGDPSSSLPPPATSASAVSGTSAQAALAYTGVPAWLFLLFVLGAALTISGAIGLLMAGAWS